MKKIILTLCLLICANNMYAMLTPVEQISIKPDDEKKQAQADLVYKAIKQGYEATVKKLGSGSDWNTRAHFWGHWARQGEGQTKPHIWVAVDEIINHKDTKDAIYERRLNILRFMLTFAGTNMRKIPDANEINEKIDWLPLRTNISTCSLCNTALCCISWLWCSPCTGSCVCNDVHGGLQHYAAQKNCVDVLKILKEHNFDMNQKDEKGRTPMMYAAVEKAQEAYKYLHDECNIIRDDLDLVVCCMDSYTPCC